MQEPKARASVGETAKNCLEILNDIVFPSRISTGNLLHKSIYDKGRWYIFCGKRRERSARIAMATRESGRDTSPKIFGFFPPGLSSDKILLQTEPQTRDVAVFLSRRATVGGPLHRRSMGDRHAPYHLCASGKAQHASPNPCLSPLWEGRCGTGGSINRLTVSPAGSMLCVLSMGGGRALCGLRAGRRRW